MTDGNEEIRRTIGIKLKPSIVRRARVGAAYSDKRLGQWIEEAIEEKVQRERQSERRPGAEGAQQAENAGDGRAP